LFKLTKEDYMEKEISDERKKNIVQSITEKVARAKSNVTENMDKMDTELSDNEISDLCLDDLDLSQEECLMLKDKLEEQLVLIQNLYKAVNKQADKFHEDKDFIKKLIDDSFGGV